MKFAHKIGLSFLLLSLLTVATGAIGLLFIHRVMSAFRSVPGATGPLIGDLADLNHYLTQAVAISQEMSADQQVDDLLQLRSEFTRLTREFDRSFERIRRDADDQGYVQALQVIKAEQSQLSEQTHSLVEAILEELEAQRAYRGALEAGRRQWATLMGLLREVSATLTATGAPGTSAEALRLLARAQLLLLDMHQRLQLYLDTTETTELGAEAALLELGAVEASNLLSALLAADLGAARAGAEGLQDRLERWAEGLSGPQGLLALHRTGVALRERTDRAADRAQAETRATLQLLDEVIAIGGRLAMSRADRGFVTAAPGLLFLSVSLATVSSVLLAVILSHAITRPVRGLTAVTEAVRRGDYAVHLEASGGDELAGLGAAFNRMVAEVRRSQQEIRRLNAGLERRVQERTTALEEEVRRRREAEATLRDSEVRYRTLIENFPAGAIMLMSRDHLPVAVGGRGLARLTGREPLQLRSETLPRRVAEPLVPRLEAAFAGARQEFELRLGELDWQLTIVPNPPTGGGDVETVTVLAVDVTEARRAEREMKRKQEQLVQADKLASLGVLVAGVAHEINNPNQAVMSTGELLRRAWPDIRSVLGSRRPAGDDLLVGGLPYAELCATMDEHIAGILQSAQRIDTIVRGLKEFASRDVGDMSQAVGLNIVVESALVLLSNMLKRSTENLRVELAPALPSFRGNAQRVEQVVINLVQNACQALQDRKAAILIRTRGARDGRAVALEVEDQGSGISPQDLPRVRDPFFTTKRTVGGTGLGLSVSATIVEEHGGEMEFLSQPGRGTTVRVTFPLQPPPAEGPS